MPSPGKPFISLPLWGLSHRHSGVQIPLDKEDKEQRDDELPEHDYALVCKPGLSEEEEEQRDEEQCMFQAGCGE